MLAVFSYQLYLLMYDMGTMLIRHMEEKGLPARCKQDICIHREHNRRMGECLQLHKVADEDLDLG